MLSFLALLAAAPAAVEPDVFFRAIGAIAFGGGIAGITNLAIWRSDRRSQ